MMLLDIQGTRLMRSLRASIQTNAPNIFSYFLLFSLVSSSLGASDPLLFTITNTGFCKAALTSDIICHIEFDLQFRFLY